MLILLQIYAEKKEQERQDVIQSGSVLQRYCCALLPIYSTVPVCYLQPFTPLYMVYLQDTGNDLTIEFCYARGPDVVKFTAGHTVMF